MECICIHHNHAFCDQLCSQLKMDCQFQRRSRRHPGDQKGTLMLWFYAASARTRMSDSAHIIVRPVGDFGSKLIAQQYTVNRSFVPL
jgi:hypothetical protein